MSDAREDQLRHNGGEGQSPQTDNDQPESELPESSQNSRGQSNGDHAAAERPVQTGEIQTSVQSGGGSDGLKCPCGNSEKGKLKELKNGNELMGVHCRSCKVEWLREEHLSPSSPRAEDDSLRFRGDIFYRNVPVEPAVSHFQNPYKKKRVSSLDELQPGDHITWERVYVIWHHAIVLKVDRDNKMITTLEWNTDKNNKKTVRVIEKEQPYDDRPVCYWFNRMYKVKYSEEVASTNKTDLVLARAQSRKGDVGYGPYNNCESFAVYCKTGYEQCHQTRWCKFKCLECCCGNTGRFGLKLGIAALQVVLSEGVEEGVEESDGMKSPTLSPHLVGELVGGAVLIFVELLIVCWIVYTAHRAKKKRHKSRMEFWEAVVQRLFEAVVFCALVISLSYVFEVELKMGFGGAILGGLIGGLLGTFFGHWIGGCIGKGVSGCCCGQDSEA